MAKLSFLKNLNKNTVLIGVAAVGIIIVGGLVYANSNPGFSLSNLNLGFGTSKDQIAQKTVDYINNNNLSDSPVSLLEVSEESGMIKIKIKIGDNEFESYVTKDGKLLFPNLPINMAENDDAGQNAGGNQPEALTCDTLEKTGNPQLEAFIVSKCPYGLQMQRMIADAVKNIPDLDKYVKVKYIGSVSDSGDSITAMHGDEEAQENLRQICIRDEQRSKYWGYISCHIKAGDVNSCLTSASIDQSKLTACMTDKTRGVAYAKEDFDLSEAYSASGSPTLVLNGIELLEFAPDGSSPFGGRTSDEIKTIICCASDSEPGFCSTQLNTAQAATGFSATYEGSGGGGAAANCDL